ncbi:MAG: chorismate mutase [Bacillota bacterium]
MDTLNKNRQRIDALDAQIMTLLDERFRLSEAIGKTKKNNDRQVSDPARETFILDKAAAYEHEASIRALYQSLFELSKKLQKKG